MPVRRDRVKENFKELPEKLFSVRFQLFSSNFKIFSTIEKHVDLKFGDVL